MVVEFIRKILKLALLQHATSKISTVADLAAINSLGFRGEALASIASVSQIELLSKHKEQAIGYVLDGNAQLARPIAHHDGSTVSVKNLFYNVPVRRKFCAVSVPNLTIQTKFLNELRLASLILLFL